jgi:hypothetical protein
MLARMMLLLMMVLAMVLLLIYVKLRLQVILEHVYFGSKQHPPPQMDHVLLMLMMLI